MRPCFFSLLCLKDSKSLKIWDIRFFLSGGKKTFKRYFKSEQTHKETNKQTHGRPFWLIESMGLEGRCFDRNVIVLLPEGGWMKCWQTTFLKFTPEFFSSTNTSCFYLSCSLCLPWCSGQYLTAAGVLVFSLMFLACCVLSWRVGVKNSGTNCFRQKTVMPVYSCFSWLTSSMQTMNMFFFSFYQMKRYRKDTILWLQN